jgi:homopolymeric O-antigen transport system ATP-binding protein
MSTPVIKVDNLGKEYVIGARERVNATFYGMLSAAMDAPLRRLRNLSGSVAAEQRLWALKDVSFEVDEGEVLGIIGRNGAGKSTLLKILSRITTPTTGRAEIRGRVASLLEVGTGFHPELTGRENIYLNGAILGMTRAEINRKFDAIVDFSGVERFLDTPVKRYSSGMSVRLAFAVAAHLDPEILIVDEVLAVGDAEFQRKCLGKMSAVARGGRTVILVSHNLGAISSMAKHALVLKSGQVDVYGPVQTAISRYLSIQSAEEIYVNQNGTPDTPYVSRAEVIASSRAGIHEFGKPLSVEFRIRHAQPMSKACFSFQIINQFQQAVAHAWALYPDIQFADKSGETILVCRFPSLRLNVGRFHLRTFLTEPAGAKFYETLDGICPFEVVRVDKSILWGWRPDACAYHEDWSWTAELQGSVLPNQTSADKDSAQHSFHIGKT